MFPTLRSIRDKREYAPDIFSLESLLKPNAKNSLFDITVFDPRIAQMLASANPKNYLLFGVSRGIAIPGLKEDTFPVQFELYHDTPEKVEGATKTSKVMTYQNGNMTDVLVMLPEDSKIRKLLDQIKIDEKGNIACGESLLERVRGCDMKSAQLKGSDLPYCDFLDPEEHELIVGLDRSYKMIISNASNVHRYFRQMSSLMLNGTFSDIVGIKFLSGIKGLSGDQLSILRTYSALTPDDMLRTVKQPIDEVQNQALKELLSKETPWYKNPQLTRPLSAEMLLREFENLGRAPRAVIEQGYYTSAAALATEAIVSELYEATTGSKIERRDDFVKKLTVIGEKLGIKDLVKPFIDLYTDKKNITPSQVRAGIIHSGQTGYLKEEADLDYWTSLFYQDLTKTLVSALAGKPKAYFDFDDFARKRGLVGGKTSVSYVPITVAKHYE